jgi:hypothetical protein
MQICRAFSALAAARKARNAVHLQTLVETKAARFASKFEAGQGRIDRL